jgi:hypothetical protein
MKPRFRFDRRMQAWIEVGQPLVNEYRLLIRTAAFKPLDGYSLSLLRLQEWRT